MRNCYTEEAHYGHGSSTTFGGHHGAEEGRRSAHEAKNLRGPVGMNLLTIWYITVDVGHQPVRKDVDDVAAYPLQTHGINGQY